MLDPVLAEKIDSASFWSKVGSAIAVLAAIIGVIALVIALDARDNGRRATAGAGLRDDVDQLQSDVDQLERQTSSADEASQDTTEPRIAALRCRRPAEADLRRPEAAGDEDISKLQKDVTDLTDRVDQVEQAQEDAAAGGP